MLYSSYSITLSDSIPRNGGGARGEAFVPAPLLPCEDHGQKDPEEGEVPYGPLPVAEKTYLFRVPYFFSIYSSLKKVGLFGYR